MWKWCSSSKGGWKLGSVQDWWDLKSKLNCNLFKMGQQKLKLPQVPIWCWSYFQTANLVINFNKQVDCFHVPLCNNWITNPNLTRERGGQVLRPQFWFYFCLTLTIIQQLVPFISGFRQSPRSISYLEKLSSLLYKAVLGRWKAYCDNSCIFNVCLLCDMHSFMSCF